MLISTNLRSEIYEEFKKKMEEEPVDKYIDNPLFGSGLAFNDEVSSYINTCIIMNVFLIAW